MATLLTDAHTTLYVKAAMAIATTAGMAVRDTSGTTSSTADKRTKDIAEPSNCAPRVSRVLRAGKPRPSDGKLCKDAFGVFVSRFGGVNLCWVGGGVKRKAAAWKMLIGRGKGTGWAKRTGKLLKKKRKAVMPATPRPYKEDG